MVNQYKEKIRRFDCAVKIVILDDELEFSKILDKKIKEYCARKDLLYDCQIFSSGKTLLEDDLSSIQVAFLDIDMPEFNGLDVAKVLHQRYPEMILIFVTFFIKYAPSGYKVNAFRYLLKTQLDEELSDCLDDLQEKLYDTNRTIQIRQRDRILPLAIKSILYFEGTSQRRVQVFLLNGETILDCEDDEHPVLLVQPAVFHRQAHAVQQDTIQGFGIRGQALEPLLLKKSLWNAVEGEKLSSLSVEVVKGHAVGSWIKNSDNTSASLRKPPCQYFWGK